MLYLYSQTDTDMTSTEITQKVRNYQGQNSFVLKMKDALDKKHGFYYLRIGSDSEK